MHEQQHPKTSLFFLNIFRKLYGAEAYQTSESIAMLTWIDSCRLQFFALSCKHRNLMQMYARSFIILRRVYHRKYLSTIGDISTRTKWLISKRYIQAILVVTLMTLAIAVPIFTRAFAITDVGSAGVFELDGNIVRDSTDL